MGFTNYLKTQYEDIKNAESTEEVETYVLKTKTVDFDLLPANYQQSLDKFATMFFDADNKDMVVMGADLSGKTFFIEQFQHEIEKYKEKTIFDKVMFFPINKHQAERFSSHEYMEEYYNKIRETYKTTDKSIICFVTSSPITYHYIKTFIPYDNVKIILEIDREKFYDLLRMSDVESQWHKAEALDVTSICFNREDLVKLMMATVVERINANSSSFITTEDHVNQLIDYVVEQVPEAVQQMKDDQGNIEEDVLVLPPGLWATIIKKISHAIQFSSNEECFEKGEPIYKKFITSAFYDYEVLINNAVLEESLDVEEITGSLDEMIQAMSGRRNVKPQSNDYEMEYKEPAKLEKRLKQTIFGQDEAINQVVESLYIPISGLNDDRKPLRSFLFLGPTGVGKTELSLTLAKELGTQDMNVIRLDMSEYQSHHEVSKLFGAPPGYAGFDTASTFLDELYANPNSIIILDEVEKAHPKIWDAFLQVLDSGRMTSGQGETVDFTKSIIIMTSNIGSTEMTHKQLGFAHGTEEEQYKEREANAYKIVNKALEKNFRPEFINRIDNIVVFKELKKESIKSIVSKELSNIQERLSSKGITLKKPSYHVVDKIIEKSDVSKYGAREIQRVVGKNISSMVAKYVIKNSGVKELSLHVSNGDITVETVNKKG